MADAQLIKKLREMTSAGFADCKKALVECNDDLEKAANLLREKGIIKAVKKAGEIATEGVVLVGKNDNSGYIVEINTQTDFAARNENFINFCENVMKELHNSECTEIEFVERLKLPTGDSIRSTCDELISKIGEKISLRRFARIIKKEEQDIGIYQHVNKKYGAICLFDKKTDEKLKKQICMHIVANNPQFINAQQVSSDWINAEKTIIEKTSQNDKKPAKFGQKIVEGRLEKRLAEICLCNQPFDFEPSITVGNFLIRQGIKILSFVRYEVGEGIEKKQQDFATEVAKQMDTK